MGGPLIVLSFDEVIPFHASSGQFPGTPCPHNTLVARMSERWTGEEGTTTLMPPRTTTEVDGRSVCKFSTTTDIILLKFNLLSSQAFT